MDQSESSSVEAGGRGDGFMLCSRAERLKPFISEMAETADRMEVSWNHTKSGLLKPVRKGMNDQWL